MQLKVMTFNIHHGKGTDGVLSLPRIGDIIADSGAHLVSLNEVDRCFSSRSEYTDQIAWLANELQMDYAYGPAVLLKSECGAYGNALLSRYPIAGIENHRFHFGLIEDRALLETTVLIDEQPVKMYVTHLSLDPVTHKRQTTFIVKKVQEDRHPTIVAGDWNMKPGAKAWKRITRYAIDAWDTVGEGTGFTFPSFRPRVRLDYIFFSDHFRIAEADVLTTLPEASDHLPLVITVNTHFPESGFHVCP